MSPYLFILCAEDLSALIDKYNKQDWLNGVKICPQAPIISHMLFAVDSYIYCGANVRESRRVLELLQQFERASGQKVNLSKSSVYFSTNIGVATRTEVCHILNMIEADENRTYRGLLSIMGRSKPITLRFLKAKLYKRLQS